jgi:hypothetical protein
MIENTLKIIDNMPDNCVINKKKAGRPRQDRIMCKKCGLEKQLVLNRLICRDCWNANSKMYYKKNEVYAQRKREQQRAKICMIKTEEGKGDI